ncbi:LacI family DNA-binding transcriptional regulator [Massilia sp. TSP1-1-2]|uniref:LacI family DNA-binding transcriptional regulator n=1 Tax=Massilia sp. TSP1-1-2 TaxID=2804649 RepID=UPI003CF00F54
MATIKDVALRAGVGMSTASRVVSGKGYVAAATIARVQKAVEELDFRPSHAARALMSGTSQMVGVYIPILKGTFYTPILAAIDAELRAADLHMVVAFGVGKGDARRQAVEGINFLLERGCDGLIVISNHLCEEDVLALGKNQSRIVFMNHLLDGIESHCFTADHHYGGVLAARALLEHGHRKIAVIGGPSTSPDNVARLSGFMGELERIGINPAGVWQTESDFSPEAGWAQAARLIESGYQFTAVFCANDEIAVGAMAYFQENGREVPRNISVIGYDDTPSAAFSSPRLTSVRIPWLEMTMAALDELFNRCYGTQRTIQRHFLISITQRASLARPPGT